MSKADTEVRVIKSPKLMITATALAVIAGFGLYQITQSPASSLSHQNGMVSGSFSNVDVRDAMKLLAEHTGVVIRAFPDVHGEIDVEVENESIRVTLDKILQGHKSRYIYSESGRLLEVVVSSNNSDQEDVAQTEVFGSPSRVSYLAGAIGAPSKRGAGEPARSDVFAPQQALLSRVTLIQSQLVSLRAKLEATRRNQPVDAHNSANQALLSGQVRQLEQQLVAATQMLNSINPSLAIANSSNVSGAALQHVNHPPHRRFD